MTMFEKFKREPCFVLRFLRYYIISMDYMPCSSSVAYKFGKFTPGKYTPLNPLTNEEKNENNIEIEGKVDFF